MEQNSSAKRLLLLGWTSIPLSAACLWVSILQLDSASEVVVVLWLMGARLIGIVGFAVGAYAIFKEFWTHGTLLLCFSLGLPFISFLFHGTI